MYTKSYTKVKANIYIAKTLYFWNANMRCTEPCIESKLISLEDLVGFSGFSKLVSLEDLSFFLEVFS